MTEFNCRTTEQCRNKADSVCVVTSCPVQSKNVSAPWEHRGILPRQALTCPPTFSHDTRSKYFQHGAAHGRTRGSFNISDNRLKLTLNQGFLPTGIESDSNTYLCRISCHLDQCPSRRKYPQKVHRTCYDLPVHTDRRTTSCVWNTGVSRDTSRGFTSFCCLDDYVGH